MKIRYFVVLYGLLATPIVVYDLKNFMFVLLPVFIFINFLGVGVIFKVKKFRRFMKLGFACLVCAMVVLILAGIVGNELNKRSYADAAVLIDTIEKFKIEQGRYPTILEMFERINPKAHLQSGIRLQCNQHPLRNRPPYRGWCVYSPEKNDSYFFSMQILPIGSVTWNFKAKVWNDGML